MKKIIVIVLLVSLHESAMTQVVVALLFGDKLNTGKLEFGLTVSPALTNISNINSKSKLGLNLGIYFNIRPDKKLFIHAEGIGKGSFGAKDIPVYSTGNDSLDVFFSTADLQRKIQSFSLPILLRYRVTEHFFAEAGIQAGLMIKAKDIFTTTTEGNDLDYTVIVTKQLTRLDFGLAAGVFYKLRKDIKSMGLGIRYYYGVVDTHKLIEGKQVNNAWLLNVTIPIGTSKPDAAKTN